MNEFIPRKPQPIPFATHWYDAEVCGGSISMPVTVNEEGLQVVLTSGPQWEKAHNQALAVGEIITNWRAGILKYEHMSFLIQDILPARGAFCMTGKRGSGKTSAAITLALHIACGAPIWGKKVHQGRVAYLAGENPPDVMRRIEETSTMLGLRPPDETLIVSHGVRDPAALFREFERLGYTNGLFDLVIVDTHQSHFIGDDLNDNVQMSAMAHGYLALAEAMAGTVLVLSHPNRAVHAKEDLVPAGGGAFLNQMDGNYTIERDEKEITLHWAEKLRSPDFTAVVFDHVHVKEKQLSYGPVFAPTVVARPQAPETMLAKAQAAAKEASRILRTLHESAGTMALDELAIDGKGKKFVAGVLNGLLKEKLVQKKGKDEFLLTEAGKAMVVAQSEEN